MARNPPDELRRSTENPDLRYRLAQDLHARRPGVPGDAVVASFADGAMTVHEGAPDPAAGKLPVYRLGENGPPAVPTGLVFVRFRADVEARTRADDLREAGYVIESALDYAPQAAWVEAADGDVASALAGVAALEALDEVENVEPQLLIEIDYRD